VTRSLDVVWTSQTT